MSLILAIDPGNIETAYVVWNPEKQEIKYKGKVNNAYMVSFLKRNHAAFDIILIEMIASYGMAVGREVFDTCRFVGELEAYCKIFDAKYRLVYRKDVKMHHCGTMKSNDSAIRQQMILKYGEPGTEKKPGKITHGLKADMWQAFAIATYYTEEQETIARLKAAKAA
jgi:hypothetical protein